MSDDQNSMNIVNSVNESSGERKRKLYDGQDMEMSKISKQPKTVVSDNCVNHATCFLSNTEIQIIDVFAGLAIDKVPIPSQKRIK